MGISKEDRFFSPASPAWGHGLWYGTFAPLSIGTAAGTYCGKFSPDMFLEALEQFQITNITAAPTVFRVVKNSGLIQNYKLSVKKISYAGEPMDTDTHRFIREAFGAPAHGGYGSTEVGPIVMDYCGFEDYEVIPGALGLPMIGVDVGIIDEKGDRVPRGEIGEIAVRRKNGWFRVKDLAVEDERGYYWHKGRADDVIISAGWTISPIEVEDKLRRHPNVLEAVVVGKPDKDRGFIVVAYVKVNVGPSETLKEEIRNFVKTELSKHEYPREIEFVDEIPLTQAGKIDRKVVKAWAAAS
jgi:acetyl-CoA synthetase